MKNKKTLIIVLIVAFLAVAVGIFAVLNMGNVQDKQASQENATVKIVQGDKTAEFDLNYLKGLKKSAFDAMQDTSKTGPEKKSFGGVPLAAVLQDKGFSLDGAKQVTFTAADGYASVVTAAEAADAENVYLVYERDGKPSGTKAQGGSGPIEAIVAKDAFSQRWCKFLMQIDIK
jgi:DMSO/TMAO reductase YedYZ molybdopterin-dependent catalytic subunit